MNLGAHQLVKPPRQLSGFNKLTNKSVSRQEREGGEGPAVKVEAFIDRRNLSDCGTSGGTDEDGKREALVARLADGGRVEYEACVEAGVFGLSLRSERQAARAVERRAEKEVGGELLARRKAVEGPARESGVRVDAGLDAQLGDGEGGGEGRHASGLGSDDDRSGVDDVAESDGEDGKEETHGVDGGEWWLCLRWNWMRPTPEVLVSEQICFIPPLLSDERGTDNEVAPACVQSQTTSEE